MPARRFEEEAVLEALNRLFRARGYDGASLSDIMAATGLAKASLYHHFADGKTQMATAVLERTAATFASYVLRPLAEQGVCAARLAETVRRLREFYDDGRLSCLLDTLTVRRPESKPDRDPVLALARATLAFWIEAFASFAQETGFAANDARTRAEAAVAAIEGSLIVARISGASHVFLAAVAELPERLMKAA